MMHDVRSELSIHQTKSLFLIRFEGKGVAGDGCIEEHKDRLLQLGREHSSSLFIFDLSNQVLLSSSSIGILFSLYRLGVEVQLYRPSSAVRDVLHITQLNQVFGEAETLPDLEDQQAAHTPNTAKATSDSDHNLFAI